MRIDPELWTPSPPILLADGGVAHGTIENLDSAGIILARTTVLTRDPDH
jgi:hypothetical protein